MIDAHARPLRWNLSVLTTIVLWLLAASAAPGADTFNFQSVLFGTPSTLGVSLQSLDPSTGTVVYSGGDTAQPSTPFSWDWGDGTVTDSFFPTSHVYADHSHNYVVNVTSHYAGGGSNLASAVVRFTAPQINPVPLASNVSVTLPSQPVTLSTRLFTPPSALTTFNNSAFSMIPRATFEYILTAAANVERGFVRDNTYLNNGQFSQVVLSDPTFAGGMYSVWYTDPIALGVGGTTLALDSLSSYFHEMGHNVTLNFPASFQYGGRIDGNANAIYSETMAQIFQHATAYQLINHAADFGLEDVATDMKLSALSSVQVVRNSFDDYVANGSEFHSWNSPGIPGDETIDTFMTLAYKFFEHAELSGQGYEQPLMRMTDLLALFNANMRAMYDPTHDSAAADAFRSTLMVAAESYAFGTDLRQEFRDLNFPVDDFTYAQLIAAVPEPSSWAIGLVALAALTTTAGHRALVKRPAQITGGLPLLRRQAESCAR